MSLDPVNRNNLIITGLGACGVAAGLKLTHSAFQQIGDFSQLTHLENLNQKGLEVFKGLGGLILAACSVKTAKWAIDQNCKNEDTLSLPALFVLGACSLLVWIGENLGNFDLDFTGGAGSSDFG